MDFEGFTSWMWLYIFFFMPDIFTADKRSEIMSRIGGKDTKPELFVRSLLHGLGYRFRLHVKDLPGKPDIVLRKFRTVIFVHGCYWHRHDKCSRGKSMPSTNQEFWESKFQGTMKRDVINKKKLKAMGWRVILVWECELKNKEKLAEKLLKKLPK